MTENTNNSPFRVISAGAVQSVIEELARPFARGKDFSMECAFGTVGEVSEWLETKPVDVVITSATAMDEAIMRGKVIATSCVPIAKVGMGVCVPSGAPMPDISTGGALARTIFAKRPIVAYPNPGLGATSGKHAAKFLAELGFAIKPVLCANGVDTCRAVAQGKANLGFAMISEIRSVKEVELVGPLPKELQLVTRYLIGLTKIRRESIAFIDFLKLDRFKAMFAEAGLNYEN